MSTGKRIISVLLAVTMMLTLIPSSIFAIDENTSVTTVGNRIGETPDWVADTSRTTEVIRLGSSSYQYSNNIIPATPSGIPESSGKWGQSAYGGETPEIPTVYLELSGNAAFFREGVLTVGGSGGSGSPTAYILNDDGSKSAVSAILTADETKEDSGYTSFTKNGETWTTRRWSWQVTGTIGDTNLNGVGKNVIFEIPYSVNGTTYYATAYSHIEKILRPNGSVLSDFYMVDFSGDSVDENLNISDLTMLIGENTYSGWYTGSPSNGSWGYINYNATTNAGANLDAGGFSSDTGAMGVADNTSGTVYSWRGDKKSNTSNENNNGFTNDSTGDNSFKRPLSTIYVDTGYDHLGTGTYNGKTNGLNLRLTLQLLEVNDTFYQFFNQVAIMEGFSTTYTDKYPPASVGNGTVAINQNDCYWKENGTYTPFANLNKLYGGTLGSASNDVTNGTTITCGFIGDATQLDTSKEYCMKTEVKTTAYGCFGSKSDFSKKYDAYEIETYPLYKADKWWVSNSYPAYAYAENYYSLKFVTYDTTTLRTLYEGITKGYINNNYSSVTYDGVTFKVSNPEAYYFGLSENSDAWKNFKKAYNAAGAILVTPDITTQDTITSAYTALKNAYNALGDVKNFTITVDHVLEDGTPITSTQVYEYIGTTSSTAGIYTADEVIAMSSGYRKITAADTYQITADELKGYSFSNGSGGKGIEYVIHTPDGNKTETEYIGTKRVISGNVDVKIYYRYATYKLTYYPNFGGKVGEDFNLAYKSYINAGGENDTYGVGGQLRNYDGGNVNHTFVGFSKGKTAANGGTILANNYTMPSEAISVYANWKVNKVDLKVNNGAEIKTMISGTAPTLVSGTENTYTYGGASYTDGEVESVTFAQPTFEQKQSAAKTGTNVVGFYYDAEHTQPVSWPLTVSYDPANALSVVASGEDGVNDYVTIYAWCEDLNNKIVFETNYGTLPAGTSNPLSFTSGQSVTAPQPTKEGYTFAGWEDVNGQLISGWHYVDGDVDKYDGSITMDSNVGFIAYARWTGDSRKISFDVNKPEGVADYAFNSTNATNYHGSWYFYQISGTTGETITNFDEVPEPRMYGFVFDGWMDENGKIYRGKVWPTEDIVLYARWTEDKYSAFIELDAYEKLEGDLVKVGTKVKDGTDTVQSARPGDVVTVRFTSTTSFYTGSAMFAIMYDKNFFSPYVPKTMAGYSNSVDFANVNPDNSYVKGTSCTLDYNIDLSSTAINYIWPSELESEKADYSVVLISLEPDVYNSTTAAPTIMNDGTWLFEMRFQVNASTTKTQGSIWMDNAWTRTSENSRGVSFYGYAQSSKTNLWNTLNNVVVPDLTFAGTTVKKEGEARKQTTITAKIQESYGSSTPAFSDGMPGNTRTYPGPTGSGALGTEIYSFPFPVTPGYELSEYWVKENGTVTSTAGLTEDQIKDYVKSGDIWYAGYMANENQDGKTYIPQWTAKEYHVKFMNDENTEDCAPENDMMVVFDQPITHPYEDDLYKEGHTFDHWVDTDTGDSLVFESEESEVILDYTMVFGKTRTKEEIVFRPVFVPDNYNITVAKDINDTKNEYKVIAWANIAKYALESDLPTYGYEYHLVKNIPEEKLPNVHYLTVSDLNLVMEKTNSYKTLFYEETVKKAIYEINEDDPIFAGQGLNVTSGTISTLQSQNRFNLGDALQGIDITLTFIPNKDKTGTNAYFDSAIQTNGDGNYELHIKAGTEVDPATIPLPTKYGYVSDGNWYRVLGTMVTNIKLGATVVAESLSYTTKFVAKNITIKALKEDGTTLFYSNVDGYSFGTKVSLLGSQYLQTDKQYYSMVGYRMAEWNATENKYVYTSDETLLTDYTIDSEGVVEEGKNVIYLLPVFEPADVNYTVEFYYENLSGGYDKLPSETGSAEYKTSKTINPTTDYAAKETTGFDYDDTNANNVLTINEISGDPTANIFKVFYKRETHTVKYFADGKQYGETETLKYGEQIVKPKDPESEGKVFVGWTSKEDSTEVTGLASNMGVSDLTYYAVFADAAHTITFMIKGNGDANYYLHEEKNIAAGEKAAASTKAFDTGYESNGKWYTNPECTSEYTFGNLLTESITLYTKIAPKVYTITFYNDGEEYGVLSFAYGADTAKAGDNTKPGTDKDAKEVKDPEVDAGMKFDGWYEDDSYTTLHTFGTMGAENIKLYGRSVNNMGSVIFYYGYEGAPKKGIFQEEEGTIGTKVTPDKMPEDVRPGYVFIGWNTDIEKIYITAETTEVYAIWEKCKYTVIYVAIDVTQPENAADVSVTTNNSYQTYTNVEYQSTLEKPADPNVLYFKFTKWTDKRDETGVEHSTMPALKLGETLYLYPHFDRITVTLLDEEGDGSEISKENSDAKTDPKEIKEIDDGHGGKIKVGYIYDFAEGLDSATVISQLAVKGNGSLVVTPYYQIGYEITTYKICGTGSTVELIDNVTGDIMERYYVIILGDINGDGRANATDCAYIRNSKTTSDNEQMNVCIKKACDVNYNAETGVVSGNGTIDNDDMLIISKLAARKLVYDRKTGTMSV